MKIGVVVDNDFINDGRVFKQVAMLKEKNDVYVLHLRNKRNLSRDNELDSIYISKRVKEILFALSSWLPIYRWIWKVGISKFIKKNDIDVLHVHDLYMALPAAAAKNSGRKNVKLIVDLHENFPATVCAYNWTKGFLRRQLTRPERWAKLEGEILRSVDIIVTLSENYKKDLVSKYSDLNPANVFVFANVVDFSRFENFTVDKDKQRDERVTFLYFGVVADRRGIFETLQVFERALAIEKKWLLRIIGPVDKSDKYRFDELLKQDSLKDNVEYIPWIPLEELLTELSRVDICLAPFHVNDQHNSGIANKIFQYMYAGKPLIVSDCRPQMELILNAECGLVFTNNDEYLRNMIHLSSDVPIREIMGEKGKRYLHSHFDSDSHSNQLFRVYQSIEL
jgi:glycosyltransferase involved in cell wall biosynthesis